MHPRLGAAIMSTLAFAVEEDQGLHIVTPSVRAHDNLLANREEQVFEALLEIPTNPVHEDDLGKTVDQLTQFVITTGFDLTRLRPEDIRDLIGDGHDLQLFREEAVSFAKLIPPSMGEEYRTREMKKRADAILEKWNDYQSFLPQSIRRSFKGASLEEIAKKTTEKAVEGISGGLAGAAITHSVLGSIPGLLISVLVVTGVKAYLQRGNHRLRFLNQIQKATHRSFGSLYVPQWTALASQSG